MVPGIVMVIRGGEVVVVRREYYLVREEDEVGKYSCPHGRV